jgi:serine/threonine protein kinase
VPGRAPPTFSHVRIRRMGDTREASTSLLPGDRVSPYEVIASVGAGGMGEVYRAHDDRLHRDVALKIVSPRFALDPARQARFAREAQVLAALNHPNIATLSDWKKSAAFRRWSSSWWTARRSRIDSLRNRPAFTCARGWTLRSRSPFGSFDKDSDHRVVGDIEHD